MAARLKKNISQVIACPPSVCRNFNCYFCVSFLPGMVSCDNETYTHSRLRQNHFKDAPKKDLKGLSDVGVIREYTEDSSQISPIAPSLPTFSHPILGRER